MRIDTSHARPAYGAAVLQSIRWCRDRPRSSRHFPALSTLAEPAGRLRKRVRPPPAVPGPAGDPRSGRP